MNAKKPEITNKNDGVIPWRISSYLKRHYDKKYMKDVKKAKRNGQVFYQLNIETENNIYRLKFNSDGYLLLKVMEPLIGSGVFEEYGGGD